MTYPSPWRTSSTVAGVSSVPAIETEPASGCTRPIISRSSVDLPQPLGPIKAVVRPAAIVRSISWRTTDPPYDFETPFSSIIQPVPGAMVPILRTHRPIPLRDEVKAPRPTASSLDQRSEKPNSSQKALDPHVT